MDIGIDIGHLGFSLDIEASFHCSGAGLHITSLGIRNQVLILGIGIYVGILDLDLPTNSFGRLKS